MGILRLDQFAGLNLEKKEEYSYKLKITLEMFFGNIRAFSFRKKFHSKINNLT